MGSFVTVFLWISLTDLDVVVSTGINKFGFLDQNQCCSLMCFSKTTIIADEYKLKVILKSYDKELVCFLYDSWNIKQNVIGKRPFFIHSYVEKHKII